MMRATIVTTSLFAILLSAGCFHGQVATDGEDSSLAIASGDSVVTGDHLTVAIEQTAWPWPGTNGEVDVPFEIRVTNHTEGPVVVERIKMESVGQGPYRIRRTSRTFDVPIDEDATSVIRYFGRAEAAENDSTRWPLILRVQVEFRSDGESVEETFVIRPDHRRADSSHGRVSLRHAV